MKNKILLLSLVLITFFSCMEEKKEVIVVKDYSKFEINLPDSDYKFLAEISEIETEIVKNAFTYKEDIYSVGEIKDGYRISLTLSIKNPYKKEMIVPFYDNIYLTSENNESFSNSKNFKKKFGEIIKPRIVYKDKNQSIINFDDNCYGGIACIHYKPMETKQYKLFFENEIVIDVKNVIFLGFNLKHNEEIESSYKEKGLIINIDQKKIIGEKKY